MLVTFNMLVQQWLMNTLKLYEGQGQISLVYFQGRMYTTHICILHKITNPTVYNLCLLPFFHGSDFYRPTKLSLCNVIKLIVNLI